jgi:hypothetical protein
LILSKRKNFPRNKTVHWIKGHVPRFLSAAILLVFAAPALAHHSFPAEFDRSRQGELKGTIVGVWFKNPHARYRMEVTAADGTVTEWDIQTTSVTSLRRVGWGPDTLTVGETVRIWGDLGHGDSKKLFMRGMEKSDGSEHLPTGPVRTKIESDRVIASAGKNYGYAQVNPDHPFDISGPWHNGYKFQLTVDDLEPRPTPFSAAGKRVFEATESWRDDVLRCMPLGLPRTFGSPYAMEIVDAGSHYLVVHEQNNMPRWIWMNGRTPPHGLPASSMGFSVGHWEEDLLVIETTRLTAGTLDGSLLPMSGEDTRIVEHWAFSDDRLTMDRTMTIYDPFYTRPLVRQRGSARRDALAVFEPAPCDPDGYFRDLLETGRLEQHLQQW